MFSVKDAGRLLRQDWKHPVELARELYAQVTSRAPKVVEAPVEISVPPGQTALRLTRTPASPAKTLAETRGIILDRRPAAPPPKPAPPPPTARPATPPTTRPGPRVGALRRQQEANQARHDARNPPRPAPSAKSEAPRRRAPSAAPPDPPRPQVQSGPGRGIPFRPADPVAAEPDGFRPYSAPLFSVEGPTVFSGPAPVQFERSPLLFDPITATYRPFDFRPKLTKIPREKPFDSWFGTVVSKQGTSYAGLPQYNVKIYPLPGGELEDTVVVTMWGLDDLNELDAGAPLWPIAQSPVDGSYYCIPNVNERLAKVTTLVTERVGAAAGVGAAQIYTMSVAGNYVANRTGNVAVYSISGHPSSGAGTIAVGTWIIIRKIFNFWHVVAADCSGGA